MNKADLKRDLAEATGMNLKESNAVIGALFDCVANGLKRDGIVKMVGFGTFRLATQKARKARNPQTGEEIDVREKTVPKFKASEALKEMVIDELALKDRD